MKVFKILLLLACSPPTSEDLIAKSSITICENTGGGDEPMSVVYEKACEKKLIVTMSVRSGQVRYSVFVLSVSLPLAKGYSIFLVMKTLVITN